MKQCLERLIHIRNRNKKLRSKQRRKIVKKRSMLIKTSKPRSFTVVIFLVLVNELTLRTDVTYVTKYGDI